MFLKISVRLPKECPKAANMLPKHYLLSYLNIAWIDEVYLNKKKVHHDKKSKGQRASSA